ncbi:MAG: thiamine diphosphokinase [Oscillospiraceae bacterium]|nr:thiamine diphosphokinase [Oscillospiraceae bacterium]
MIKRCYIVGAGEYSAVYTPEADDYIIAADGGYDSLMSRGIIPDLVVGDFDSLGMIPNHPNIYRTEVEKDDTDMVTAVEKGLANGCNEFLIDGCLGGRLDHTYANIQTLVYLAQNGARAYLLGDELIITAIFKETISFNSKAAGRISVFSSGNIATGVTINGLKYNLDNGQLSNDYPLGVSNEFIGSPANITVKDGTLIIMWAGGLNDIV